MIVKIVGLVHKVLEGVDIPAVVAGLIDGGFSDERDMSEAGAVEQNAEWFNADGTFSNVLMAVELRSSRSLGVVAMDDFHMVQANGRIEMLQGLVETRFADDVVAGNMRVAGINACGYRDDATEAADDFGDLLEASSEREFGTGGILDEDGQARAREIETLGGSRNGSGGLQQARFAIGAAK